MNSSGIKRGLAIAAAAAVAVGTPAAVFAAGTNADADVYAISQSTDSPSIPAYSYATIDGKATAKGGVDLYTGSSTTATDRDYLSVKIAESIPAGTTIDPTDPIFSFDKDGDPSTTGDQVDVTAADLDNPISTTTTLANATTVSATFSGTAGVQFTKITGEFSYAVAGVIPGTVTATTGTATAGGTASTSLTVGKVQSGNGAVASVKVTPSSVDQYDDDTPPTYTVTALDANGVAVDNATIKVTVNGVYNNAGATADQTTSLDEFGETGEKTFTIPESASGKTDTLVFFVEPPTTPNINQVDSSDPSQTVTARFTSNAALNISYSNSTASFADDTLPADEAATVPVSVKVVDTTTPTAKPVAGVKVKLSVTSSVSGVTFDPITVTTGTDGKATANFSVPKEATAATETLTLSATVAGHAITGGADHVITFAARQVHVSYAGTDGPGTAQAQAVNGGTVSLPITVEDQFGKPAANATLAYRIEPVGTTRGNDRAATPLTTDANGQYTITYTDANKTTSNDHVIISDPFGTFGGGDLLTINVTYLNSLAADATQSKYGTLTQYMTDAAAAPAPATAVNSSADPNPAPLASGAPGAAFVVSADPADFAFDPTNPATWAAASPHYVSVLLKSSEGVGLIGQKVTFSAPGAVLVDPSDADNPVFGLGTLDVTTNGQGEALVAVTAITAGDVTVTATSGDFSHSFNPIRFDPDNAYNISLASQPETVAPGSSVKYVYTLTDQFGNPIYGKGADGVNPNFTDPGATATVPSPSVYGDASTLGDDYMGVYVNGSTGNATDPGMVTGGGTVDSNSQAALILTTLDSDTGSGTLVATATGNIATAKYAPEGAPDELSALLKEYNVTSGVSTPFTVGTTPQAKTDPTVKVGAKSKVTFTKKNGKRVRHNWDVLTVHTNAPTGTAVHVKGKTHKVKANGKVGVFKFADKAPKKFHKYKVTVAESDTTNAKTVSKKVK